MSTAAIIGLTIVFAPFVAAYIGLAAWCTSDAEGRRQGVFVLGATTILMIPVVVGFAIAGRPAWLTLLAVVAGIDLSMLVIGFIMARIERARGAKP